MKINKVSSMGLTTAATGLKTAKEGLQKVSMTFEDGLTSSVIGSEEEQDQEIKKHLSSSEWNAYRRMPEAVKRRLRGNPDKESASEEDWLDRVRGTVAEKRREAAANAGMQKCSAVRGVGVLNRPGTIGVAPGTHQLQTAGSALGREIGAAASLGSAAAKSGRTAAKAGAAAGTGAASAGVTVGVEAVKKSEEAAKRAAERIRDALSATTEGEKMSMSLRWQDMLHSMKQNRQEGAGGSEEAMGRSGKWLLIFSAAFFILLILLLPLLFLSGSGQTERTDGTEIVAVAREELEISDENVGGVKYKLWYGMDADWCAMFVSWCSDQCGYVEAGIMPKTASVSTMRSWYEQRDLFRIRESGYEPRAGDVVIFGNGMSHTGLVVEYDPDTKILTTIEGNTGSSGTTPYHKGSRVRMKRYPINYDHIIGYGTPEYPEPEEEEATEGMAGEVLEEEEGEP